MKVFQFSRIPPKQLVTLKQDILSLGGNISATDACYDEKATHLILGGHPSLTAMTEKQAAFLAANKFILPVEYIKSSKRVNQFEEEAFFVLFNHDVSPSIDVSLTSNYQGMFSNWTVLFYSSDEIFKERTGRVLLAGKARILREEEGKAIRDENDCKDLFSKNVTHVFVKHNPFSEFVLKSFNDLEINVCPQGFLNRFLSLSGLQVNEVDPLALKCILTPSTSDSLGNQSQPLVSVGTMTSLLDVSSNFDNTPVCERHTNSIDTSRESSFKKRTRHETEFSVQSKRSKPSDNETEAMEAETGQVSLVSHVSNTSSLGETSGIQTGPQVMETDQTEASGERQVERNQVEEGNEEESKTSHSSSSSEQQEEKVNSGQGWSSKNDESGRESSSPNKDCREGRQESSSSSSDSSSGSENQEHSSRDSTKDKTQREVSKEVESQDFQVGIKQESVLCVSNLVLSHAFDNNVSVKQEAVDEKKNHSMSCNSFYYETSEFPFVSTAEYKLDDEARLLQSDSNPKLETKVETQDSGDKLESNRSPDETRADRTSDAGRTPSVERRELFICIERLEDVEEGVRQVMEGILIALQTEEETAREEMTGVGDIIDDENDEEEWTDISDDEEKNMILNKIKSKEFNKVRNVLPNILNKF